MWDNDIRTKEAMVLGYRHLETAPFVKEFE